MTHFKSKGPSKEKMGNEIKNAKCSTIMYYYNTIHYIKKWVYIYICIVIVTCGVTPQKCQIEIQASSSGSFCQIWFPKKYGGLSNIQTLPWFVMDNSLQSLNSQFKRMCTASTPKIDKHGKTVKPTKLLKWQANIVMCMGQWSIKRQIDWSFLATPRTVGIRSKPTCQSCQSTTQWKLMWLGCRFEDHDDDECR